MKWQPGDLVQVRAGALSQGLVGIVIGRSVLAMSPCLDVLFSEGIRAVHPENLQQPNEGTMPLTQACGTTAIIV